MGWVPMGAEYILQGPCRRHGALLASPTGDCGEQSDTKDFSLRKPALQGWGFELGMVVHTETVN